MMARGPGFYDILLFGSLIIVATQSREDIRRWTLKSSSLFIFVATGFYARDEGASK
jgi:hypothetical protein